MRFGSLKLIFEVVTVRVHAGSCAGDAAGWPSPWAANFFSSSPFFRADHDGHLHAAHEFDPFFQARASPRRCIKRFARCCLPTRSLMACLPVRLDLVVHLDGGEFVHRDDHALAEIAAASGSERRCLCAMVSKRSSRLTTSSILGELAFELGGAGPRPGFRLPGSRRTPRSGPAVLDQAPPAPVSDRTAGRWRRRRWTGWKLYSLT
jgi:hypothetical protein